MANEKKKGREKSEKKSKATPRKSRGTSGNRRNIFSIWLVIIVVVALWLAMRLRARTDLRSDRRPLPVRKLGGWRFPALLLPTVYLGAGVLLPVIVMGRWAAGSTNLKEPMSFGVMRDSFYAAFEQSSEDLAYTMKIALVAAVGLELVAAPLARRSARRLLRNCARRTAHLRRRIRGRHSRSAFHSARR